MKLENFYKILDTALAELLHGQLVNASAFRGIEQERHLKVSFDVLSELEANAVKVATDRFKE
jgi:hypothetical protein